MQDLEQDMLTANAPQGQAVPQEQASMSPVADAMSVGVQDATGDFITTLTGMLERTGIDLDEVMEDDVEGDLAGVADDADPLELLNEQEMTLLIQKFNALEPDVQAQLTQAFEENLPPKFVQRLRAMQRVLGGREL